LGATKNIWRALPPNAPRGYGHDSKQNVAKSLQKTS